jgi:fatty aldehyde-generating acyl-ACP reductase
MESSKQLSRPQLGDFISTISDRRVLNRISLTPQFPCNYKRSKLNFSSKILNISYHGICLKTEDYSLNKGDHISVEINNNALDAHGISQPICEVKWKAPYSDNSFLVGLEIVSFEKEMVDFILKHDLLFEFSNRRKMRRYSKKGAHVDSQINISDAFDVNEFPKYRRFNKDRRSNLNYKNSVNSQEKRSLERRYEKPFFSLKTKFISQSIKSLITVPRDLLFFILPSRLIRLLVGSGGFAFIAHPRDINDVFRMFPFAKLLPKSILKFWFRYQWPFIASKVKAYNPSASLSVSGWILISPLWTEQMIRNTDLARKRIVSTSKLADKLGVNIIGLGAFTSIVTHDGLDVLGNVKAGVTTGNSFSAAVAVSNLVYLATLLGLNTNKLKVGIVGAAGSVGSGCAKALFGLVNELCLVDINEKALKNLMTQLSLIASDLTHVAKINGSQGLDDISSCDAVIVVTNAIGAIINEQHLKPGAIVIDCAQPKNVSKQVPLVRKDVLVVESAIVSIPGLDCGFDLDLGDNEALGCLAESLMLSTLERKKHIFAGKADHMQVLDSLDLAASLGIRLAYFRNSHSLITEKDIEYVRGFLEKEKKVCS